MKNQTHKSELSTASQQSRQQEKRLWIALSITTIYIFVEIIGSIISGSLTLLSDAAHLFTDAAALIISIVAMRLSRRSADKKRTFGYYRIEILAAAINASLLFFVASFIFYEAYQRLHRPSEIHSILMLLVAVVGFIVNLISVRLLRQDSFKNINIKSAYLDALADLISSVAVILTSILIYYTKWHMLDSIVAIGISLWILPRAWRLMKECVNILLEGVPEGIEVHKINNALLTIPGVQEVHDVHVWALTSGKISLTAHVVIDKSMDNLHENLQTLLQAATKILEEQFNITHSTIQFETVKCSHDDN